MSFSNLKSSNRDLYGTWLWSPRRPRYFISSMFFFLSVFLQFVIKSRFSQAVFLNTHADAKHWCSGSAGTPCPSLCPATFRTSSRHSSTWCQMDLGRMQLWCVLLVHLFERDVLQPTCQSCWLTITFAGKDHFWHGCHTNSKLLTACCSNTELCLVEISHHVIFGLIGTEMKSFSVCLHSEKWCCPLWSGVFGTFWNLSPPLAVGSTEWKFANMERRISRHTNKCASVGKKKKRRAPANRDTSAYQAVFRAYSKY